MSQQVQIRSDEYVSIWHRVPSWAISLGLHAGLFLLFVSTMRGCGGSASGDSGEQFRSIGIFVKDSESTETEVKPVEPQITTNSSQHIAEMTSVDEQPTSDLSMPAQAFPEIGAGPPPLPPTSLGSGEIRQVVKSGGQLIESSLGLGPGETRFVDIRDSGDRFVYVIDRSGSMLNHGKMNFVHAQLQSSLNVLQPYQQFQILFYNNTVTELRMPGRDRNGFYPANERNVRSALAIVKGQAPAEGTNHIPGLKAAVKLKADVIFFLTDGVQRTVPPAGDLLAIKQANAGRSRVHCIEFGETADLSGASWLRKVARDNGGQYKYIDVTRLKSPRR